MLVSLSSLVMLCYMLHVKPFESKEDNVREIFNELCTFLITV
jgi:hypothetical protein